jgi:fimbrial chaperone protein
MLLVLVPGTVKAANFTVDPIKLFFTGNQRTDVISIKNNSDDKLALQVSVFHWEQDEEGKDRYTPTEDVVLFPKMLNMESNDEHIVRVGRNVLSGKTEKTYRIYLEEIPQPGETSQRGATLRTLMRIGIPVFFIPAKEEASGLVRDASLQEGKLSLVAKNSGNVHFVVNFVKLEGVDVSEASVFKTEVAGWYLLPGSSRKYTIEIPYEECRNLAVIRMDMVADKLSVTERLDVTPEMCTP